MPAWPQVSLFVDHQITDICETAQVNVGAGYTGFLHITSLGWGVYYLFPHKKRKLIFCFLPWQL